MSYKQKPPVGSIGIAAIAIAVGDWGEIFIFYFPYDVEKNSPGVYRVHALNDIRANKSVTVVDGNCGAVEEAESNPTTSPSLIYDDYAQVPFTLIETEYDIGYNAHQADPTVPLFTATQLSLMANQNCWVKFNSATRVRHYLLANTPYTYPLNVSAVFVTAVVLNGLLYLDAVGVG
ncbi:MAG: hypothetical protein ABSF24_02405 [Candidatus Bathyarchaeia archaeon]|jgi:hypothetical protein